MMIEQSQSLLILGLAIGAYGIRLSGLLIGDVLAASPKLKSILDTLPGCLIVALVASSLADQPPAIWGAALIALIVAVWSNNVPITMLIGFVAAALLTF